jgi:hypothetical protein
MAKAKVRKSGAKKAKRVPKSKRSEPPRVCRRAQLLSRKGHDRQDEQQVLT